MTTNNEIAINEITILLSGSSNVGKKTFMTRHFSGDFKNTMTQMIFNRPTTIGLIKTEVYLESNLPEGKVPDVILYMGSHTNFRTSLYETEMNSLKERYPGVPIIFIINKVDVVIEEELEKKNLRKTQKLNEKLSLSYLVQYSSKSNYNFEKPFVRAYRLKFGQDDIHLV